MPTALRAFERALLAQVPAFVARLRLAPEQVAEVRQVLGERLLTPRPEGPPRISAYSGHGPLGAWLRVAATRVGLEQARAAAARPELSVQVEAAVSEDNPELQAVRERCKAAFAEALRDATAELSAEQRSLLRMHFVDGLSSAQISALYQVNRSTAVRWLQEARAALAQRTRRLLTERLHLSESDVQSVLALVYSQLDVSIAGLLGRGA